MIKSCLLATKLNYDQRMKPLIFVNVLVIVMFFVLFHKWVISKEEGNIIHLSKESSFIPSPETSKTEKFRTDVVMFIPSPVQWEDRRKYVYAHFEKEGWKREQVTLLFVYGNRTGDSLQDFVDTSVVVKYPMALNIVTGCRDMDYGQEFNSRADTSATTCKVYEAYKYITRHYESRYVWRGADDSYVNLRYFMKIMPTLQEKRLFMGWLRRADTIQNDLLLERQPALKELYGLYQFGQYMSGMGFLMSYDVAEFIGLLTIPPHLTWCEDVMVGMWLNPFQISFTHHPGFHCQGYYHDQPAVAGTDYLVVHRMHPEQWAQIGNDGRFNLPN